MRAPRASLGSSALVGRLVLIPKTSPGELTSRGPDVLPADRTFRANWPGAFEALNRACGEIRVSRRTTGTGGHLSTQVGM